MPEGMNKRLASLSIIIILMSLLFLSAGDDSEDSPSHNYPLSEIEIFSKGEVIEIHPNSVESHQNWSVSPSLPEGLRMFKDSFHISERAIDSYGNKTCSITPIGGVICWSDFSQYNDLAEVIFEEMGSHENVATGISVGGKHSCALINNSISTGVNCWGSDNRGQLGDGLVREDSRTPVKIASIEGSWIDVSSGDSHSCGILPSSGIYCWGSGEFGQIGDGTRADRFSPAQVSIGGVRNFVSIESGDFHNCALTEEGEVWCWGWNGYGQVGSGNFEDSMIPSMVNLGMGVIAKSIFTGPAHSCAIVDSDEAYCWGRNTENQISEIEDESIEEPLQILAGTTMKVEKILTGGSISCLTNDNGELDCIGIMSSKWRDGIEEMGDVRYFATGSDGYCLLNYSGIVRCADHSGAETLMTEEGGVFQMIIPSTLNAGSISGIAVDNGNSRHNITSVFEGEELTSSITILIDFEMDIDSDGWLNNEELVCGSDRENKFSTPVDTDFDGQCDLMDEDDDGDGVLDFKDKFPLDNSEWSDDDGDGIGKNSDGFEISEPVYGILVTMSILILIFLFEVTNSSSRKKG